MGIRFVEHTRQWVCDCDFHEAYGTCRHVSFYRRITDVNVKEEYL